MRSLTSFEKNIQSHLQAVPPRKYDLWQLTEQGQIVGYHYASVEFSFKGEGREYSECPVGWHYVIEQNGCHHVVHESSVKLREG